MAKTGPDGFYKGPIARTISDFIQAQGGFLSYEDLASHQSEWVQPLSCNYRGYDVWELPPNGQGTAALQILNILEHFDLRTMGFGSADYIHHFTEAKKIAFEDRAKFYADPAFNDIPIDTLISETYAKRRAAEIGSRAKLSYDAYELEQGNTVYLTVADQWGNMVSLIQSNYRGMGSGMVPDDLGFMLQDRGELFVGHGVEIYEGQVVGIHSRSNDLPVNPTKAKQLTNIRASGSDENLILSPHIEHTLEQALEFIAEDELVEVTPSSIRIRKKLLTENARKRAQKATKNQ